jgi:hypothetical protein
MFQLKMLPDPDPAAQTNTVGILTDPDSQARYNLSKNFHSREKCFGSEFPQNLRKILLLKIGCCLLVPGAWKSFRRVWKKYIAFFEQTILNFFFSPFRVLRSLNPESTNCQRPVLRIRDVYPGS